jgi:hypothetical protein
MARFKRKLPNSQGGAALRIVRLSQDRAAAAAATATVVRTRSTQGGGLHHTGFEGFHVQLYAWGGGGV